MRPSRGGARARSCDGVSGAARALFACGDSAAKHTRREGSEGDTRTCCREGCEHGDELRCTGKTLDGASVGRVAVGRSWPVVSAPTVTRSWVTLCVLPRTREQPAAQRRGAGAAVQRRERVRHIWKVLSDFRTSRRAARCRLACSTAGRGFLRILATYLASSLRMCSCRVTVRLFQIHIPPEGW